MKLKNKLILILTIISISVGLLITFANTDYASSQEGEISVTSEHILPPGSTATTLQNAIDSSAPGDIITISSNISLYSTIGLMVESEKDITIQSNAGNNWTIYQREDNMFHFYITGKLTLQNITIDGDGTGGLVYVYGGDLTLNDGAIVQNCISPDVAGGIGIFSGNATMNGNSIVRNCSATLRGGGVYISQGTFTMNDDSVITNCTATSDTNSAGGGVNVYESIFNMNGNATVTECSSNVKGGGVYVNDGTFNLNSGNITKNTANMGGGIYVNDGRTIVGDATISENTVDGDGGGIYLTNAGSLETTGNTSIINNSASSGNGGGIYTENKQYENLATGDNTQFDNNISSVEENPPSGAQDLYPNIKFANTSIFDHPLNNYDINYSTVYSIEYNANGGTGGYTITDIEPGSIRTILSPEDVGIERPNYTFLGWNTQQDGGGTTYQAGGSITVEADIILYAQWVNESERTVTFETNGGSLIDDRIVIEGETVKRPTDPVKEGYVFDGWYTDNETFENKWDFNTTITDDITLYAKWKEAPSIIPCSCIYIVAIFILALIILFWRQIWRLIRYIICKIKRWIRCL